MKVYLVYNYYYDCEEYAHGNMLLGIFSSMEAAIQGRKDFMELELEECRNLGIDITKSTDYKNDPVITKFSNGKPFEECTYTIEEWTVE